jgi:hypothetical protein
LKCFRFGSFKNGYDWSLLQLQCCEVSIWGCTPRYSNHVQPLNSQGGWHRVAKRKMMWLVKFEIAAYRGWKKLEDDGDASFSGSETCRRRMQCVIKYFSVVYTVCLYVTLVCFEKAPRLRKSMKRNIKVFLKSHVRMQSRFAVFPWLFRLLCLVCSLSLYFKRSHFPAFQIRGLCCVKDISMKVMRLATRTYAIFHELVEWETRCRLSFPPWCRFLL